MSNLAPPDSLASGRRPLSGRSRFYILAVIVLAIVFVYGRSLTFGFVAWDDHINVYKNEHIQKLDGPSLAWMFTNTQAALRYKPLSWLAWASIHSAFGLDPLGYHLANILLHCLNSLLLFALLQALFASKDDDNLRKTSKFIASALAVLLWALHPLRVEPVAWVTGLPYGLSVCFLLASALFHLRAKEDLSPTAKRGYYWCSVGFFLLSALAYPVGLMFPFALLVFDTYLLDKKRRAQKEAFSWQKVVRTWVEKAPYLIITFLFIAITVRGRVEAEGIWSKPVALTDFGIVPRTMQAFYIWAYYVWKSFLPFNLSPLYTTLYDFDPWSWPFLASAAFVLGFTGLLIWKRSRWQSLLALWICYLVLLVPVLGLTEHPHFPSDRYGFLGSMLWSILFAGLVFKFSDLRTNSARPILVGGIALLFVLGAMSYQQTAIWRNSTSLFEQMAEHNPHASRVLEFLANQHKSRNEPEKALECYDRLIKDDPTNLQAHEGMGTILFDQGRFEDAKQHYFVLVGLAPQNAQFHNDLGVILAASGDLPKAIQQFEAALRIQPNFVSANQNMAKALSQQGRPKDAEVYLKKATATPTTPTSSGSSL